MKVDQNDKKFWEKFYSRSNYCPSGHYVAAEKAILSGFIMQLIQSTKETSYDPKALPKQVTEILYQCFENLMKWHSGIFISKRKDGFLVPQFSHYIVKTNEEGVTKKKKRGNHYYDDDDSD